MPFARRDRRGLARSLGCQAERVDDHAGPLRAIDAALPSLAGRGEPLVLAVVVEPDADF